MFLNRLFIFSTTLSVVLLASCTNINPSAKDITTFSINGVDATINEISITVTLDPGTEVTSLTPSITVSDGATVSPGSGVTKDFSAPVIYTVTAFDGSIKQYVAMVNSGTVDPTELCNITIDPTSNGFQYGDGTIDHPYVICNSVQLNLISSLSATQPAFLNKHYKLGTNINMDSVSFTPIGDYNSGTHQGFTGVFDGNNKKISNLTINYNTGVNAGFIGYLNTGGIVKNLGLTNVNISGTDSGVGGLVGYSRNATVINTYVTGSISGTTIVGGLIGAQEGSVTAGCYATGTITGTGDYVGGLVGSADGTEITNSYSTSTVITSGNIVGGLVGSNTAAIFSCLATGAVSGVDDVGGLVGHNYSSITNAYAGGAVTGIGNNVGGLSGYSEGEIGYSYATGNVNANASSNVGGLIGYNDNYVHSVFSTGMVSGSQYVGGLIGYNNSEVSNSFATGDVSGQDYVGGLLGASDLNAYIYTSYSIGAVEGSTNVGGLIGDDAGDGDYNYWNTETSGQPDIGVDPHAIGQTTTTMSDPSSAMYVNWNFTHIWSFDTDECFSISEPPFLPPYCCLRPYVDF